MSFFSKSTGNRRIKRSGPKRKQSLLEVTARPDREQRRQSRRKMGAALKVLLCIGVIVGTVLGGKTLVNRLIWENPTYALDDIRVTTDGLLTRAQILEIMDIRDGKNIFTVDLGKARKALDMLPQVERVDLRRVLPSRIDIRISERQPVAWVAPSASTELGIGGKALLVDTRGYVMRTRKVLPEHLALPVLIGVEMEDVAPGQKLPTAEAIAAIELIKLSVDDIRWQPRVVDVSKGYCLVVTDQRKAKVTFGFDNMDGQLARLRQIIDYVEPSHREFQSVNLMLERSVPIVFAPPAAPVPPAAPPSDTKSAKGKGVKTAANASGSVGSGVSGGVPAALPSAVLDEAPVRQQADGRRSGPVANRASQPEPRRAQPEPPSPFKMARLTNDSATFVGARPPSEKGVGDKGLSEKRDKEKPAVLEKPQRRIVPKEPSEPQEEAPVRRPAKTVSAPKGNKTEESERPEPRTERIKAQPAEAPQSKPKGPQSTEPPSLPPDDSLRKLFNPHG